MVLNWIKSLSWPWMLLVMICCGTAFWGVVAAAFCLWDAIRQTLLHRYAELKRENARLKKYISELRRENINVR